MFDHLLQHYLINIFQTDNKIYNILIIIVITFLFSLLNKYVINNIVNNFNNINNNFFNRYYELTITTHNISLNQYVSLENNEFIQKAIFFNLKDKEINFKKYNIKIINSLTSKKSIWEDRLEDKLSFIPTNNFEEIEPGLFIKCSNTFDEKNVKHTITLTSLYNDKIKNFIKESRQNYILKIKLDEEDTTKYYYIYDVKKEDKNRENKIFFKRYNLIFSKTFDCLFFPEKDNLIECLNNFINKTGFYKIPTYPHKLGLLLSGPPGTGKTSLIKAIANYTNRNIISIQLDKINTNQELMDLFFNNKISVSGLDNCISLKTKDVIYILEDIDCTTDIVLDRNNKDYKIIEKEEEGNTLNDLIELISDKDHNKINKDHNKINKDHNKIKDNNKDKLNLSGILNVFDGILESQNRLMIITTNHVEKIDKALIRSGRIDKKIHMGFLDFQNMIKLIKYYYNNIKDEHIYELEKKFILDKYSPADIEGIVSNYKTIDEFISKF